MKVTNRSAHRVVYTIPNGPRRVFNPGETLEITAEELTQLYYQPGGNALLDDCLMISRDGREQLDWFSEVQPEYDYTEAMIKNVMVSGSLDEFLDMLDFAPDGVITLIKEYALTLPLSDMNKMQAIKDATGFDVAQALRHQEAVNKDLNGGNTSEETAPRQRRVQPQAPSKYKVIE